MSEVETQVMIAQRLSYLTEAEARPVLDLTREVGRIVNGLMTSLTHPSDH